MRTIEDEKYTEECCGTCIYNIIDKDRLEQTVFMCNNIESDFYGNYLEYTDVCIDYEEK